MRLQLLSLACLGKKSQISGGILLPGNKYPQRDVFPLAILATCNLYSPNSHGTCYV